MLTYFERTCFYFNGKIFPIALELFFSKCSVLSDWLYNFFAPFILFYFQYVTIDKLNVASEDVNYRNVDVRSDKGLTLSQLFFPSIVENLWLHTTNRQELSNQSYVLWLKG